MHMRTFVLLCASVMAYCCCPRVLAEEPHSKTRSGAVAWEFKLTPTDKDTSYPHSDVYLKVAGKKTLIRKNVIAKFHSVDRSGFKERKVPASALAACAGWWAGQGVDLYVVRKGAKLLVYQRELDEQAAIPSYRRIKTIDEHRN